MPTLSRCLTVLALSAVAVLGTALLVQAQTPPLPTFAYLYGRVTLGGGNVIPEEQPVIAFANGKSCGAPSQTFVAVDGDDVPPEDVGATVYVIDVLASGSDPYEREGCGHPGASIQLYLPRIGRMSSTQPLFQAGPIRADLELDVLLQYRASVPFVSADGGN